MAYASQSALRYWWGPPCRGVNVTVRLNGNGRVTVKASIVEATKALNAVLVAYNYQTRYGDTGAYNCRRVTGGSSYSLHAYAIALDINWSTNPYSYRLITDMFRPGDHQMPYRIEAIRTKSGHQVWRWGGKFSGNKDAMHYEITCSPSALRTGIDWRTVYGGTAGPAPTPAPTTSGDPVLRIYWFKNGNGPAAAYRCIVGRYEKASPTSYGIWSAAWIPNMEDLAVFKKRGMLEANTAATPVEPRPSYEIHGGPYDNTK